MEITTGRTIRWIAGLTGTALIAAVGYTALRLSSGEEVRRAAEPRDASPQPRVKADGPPGIEEVIAAAAAIAEDTPAGRLVAAARAGNAERVRELLAEGIPPGAEESKNGHRALHQAAASGKIEVVEVLLDAGAEVDALDGAGLTALMRAAGAASVSAGRRLLDAGAEVNARSEPAGETALTRLASGLVMRHFQGSAGAADATRQNAEPEFARMLFERGADPNLSPAGSDGERAPDSPLKMLAVTQNAELLTLFVEHGARADQDPDLALLAMMPGPIGDALRIAIANAPEPAPAEKPATH